MKIRKVTKRKIKLKLGISGVSGSGKTYSALLLAHGITEDWSKVVIIDTENGSADLYESLGEYNVLTLEPPYSPEKYIEAIEHCENEGMEVIIIDSITHEWKFCLDLQAQLGGTFRDWRKVTPRHDQFITSILQSKSHVITTVRSKQDYAMEKNNEGKNTVTKLGMANVTREGFEYELTLSFDLDIRHFAKSSKDRTGLFMDKPEFVITGEIGRKLLTWCNSGKEPLIKSKHELETELRAILKENKIKEVDFLAFYKDKKNVEMDDLLFDDVIQKIKNSFQKGELQKAINQWKENK